MIRPLAVSTVFTHRLAEKAGEILKVAIEAA